LQRDNIVDPRAKSLVDLDITPQSVESVAPAYLNRFRPQGEVTI
jgi:hypothetical protein